MPNYPTPTTTIVVDGKPIDAPDGGPMVRLVADAPRVERNPEEPVREVRIIELPDAPFEMPRRHDNPSALETSRRREVHLAREPHAVDAVREPGNAGRSMEINPRRWTED